MRIVVDATMVKRKQAGIRTYATGLTRALAELPDTEVVVLTSHFNDDEWGEAETLRTGLTRQDPYSRAVWRRLHVPHLARRLHADALVVPAPEPIVVRGITQGIVVHDLGPLLAPGVYGRRRQLHYAATLRSSVRRSDVVFTPTVSTKLDVLRWTGLDQCHIAVAGPELQASTGRQLCHPASDLREPFALYVGAMLPHKNVGAVIDCFTSGEEGPRGCLSKLVIVGPQYGDEVRTTMRHARGSSAVEHRGFVSASELAELYAAASAVVFPSLFEGFGLPLLEAIAHGSPVVASDIPALREVGGDRVTYVRDPTDREEWRDAIAAASRRSRSARGSVSWTTAGMVVRRELSGERPGEGARSSP